MSQYVLGWYPGSERFKYAELAGFPCYLTDSTIGGSCLFRVEALQKLFEGMPMKYLVKKNTWDWGVTSMLSKKWKVVTVRNTLCQQFAEGVHKFVAGNRFVGEGK